MDEMTDSQALHRTVLLTEAADEVSRARNGIFCLLYTSDAADE